MAETLTLNDLFILFDKRVEDTRWIRGADSADDLAIATYLAKREAA